MGVDTSRDDDLRVPYVKVITKLGIVIKKTNDIMNMAAFLLTAFIKISSTVPQSYMYFVNKLFHG